MEVHRIPGNGLQEVIYQRAFELEIRFIVSRAAPNEICLSIPK